MPTVSMILFVILVLVLDSMTHFIMTLSIFRLIPAPVITGPDLQSVVDITVLPIPEAEISVINIRSPSIRL